jgi:hypothetical protein
MTSNNTSGRRGRTMAGVMLVAAGASVTGLLGAAAPANAAADSYVALAVGYANDAPPVKTIGGMSIGPAADEAGASLSNCVNNGGHQCVFEVSAKNACAAAAANDFGEIEAAADRTLRVAEENARNKLQNQQGGHVVVSGCSNGQVSPPPPPPAPKLGPTVSFNPVIGGLEAHITDRSGVSSQCTYATDNFNRGFALPANSTYNLRIVPAVPQFRNWNVTITCDNGTTTRTTTYF